MNPYVEFNDLLFTCVNGPRAEVINTVLNGFNQPNQWSPRDAHGHPIIQYFVRDVESISFPYVDRAERDTTKAHRIMFWEPRIHPGVTAFMGVFHDGLSHSVFRLSEDSPYTWVNTRIYEDAEYPGCFFDFYADHRRIQRRLMASKDEDGWEFIQNGPVQSFEDTTYYSRRLIKDRLNKEIITEYLKKLGYMVSHKGFWEASEMASELWQERPRINV